jgi:hypothetical protein
MLEYQRYDAKSIQGVKSNQGTMLRVSKVLRVIRVRCQEYPRYDANLEYQRFDTKSILGTMLRVSILLHRIIC